MDGATTKARTLVAGALTRPGPIVFLTGAGISAESGIPTFRGPEGFWRVGSVNYRPEELATREAFERMPEELWAWYLWRRDVCRGAQPNAAHRALVQAERHLGDRFRLVTQNVDGLHLRAGNSLERTWQIHGNIDFMRCGADCCLDVWPLPDGLGDWSKERRLSDHERALLRCPRCGARARPHVLWFDESYDEPRYRWDSSLDAAETASLLVVVGTSGATNLPMRMALTAAERDIPLVVVNADPSPFSTLARQSGHGAFLQGRAGEHVPALVSWITGSPPA